MYNDCIPITVNADYLSYAGGSIILSFTVTSVEVTFDLVDDAVPEDPENLQAVLSFSSELESNIVIALSPSEATVTIFDNDNGGKLNFAIEVQS